MSRTFNNIPVPVGGSLEEALDRLQPGYGTYRVRRKSVDARSKRPKWIYTVEVFAEGESAPQETYPVAPVSFPKALRPPIVVGSGPAGLFAALRLAERGIPCRLLEQGSEAVPRMRAIARHWRYGELDPKNNVCFGEGGAGLYSDGKLITRIKSPHIPYVLHRLVQFGAPEEIQWLANPHVGSDRIRKVIPVLRGRLRELGCEIRFNTKVVRPLFEGDRVKGVQLEDGTELESDHVVLATGHSAEDMFEELSAAGVALEGKSFAVGLRIEHPQSWINRCQFGDLAEHPDLGAASYRLADHDKGSGVGVYSFCMCPGGYVIASNTSEGTVVSNGMSNYARNSPFANAAIVISLDYESLFGKDVFAGLNFRRTLERTAYRQVKKLGAKREFPAQRVVDFLEGRAGQVLKSSSPSGVVPVRLDKLFDSAVRDRLASGLQVFDRRMRGFISPQAQLHGVESRTSCPIRIPRDSETLQSLSHGGLYPAGEGAGYAGGITSAAVDGVRIAEAIALTL